MVCSCIQHSTDWSQHISPGVFMHLVRSSNNLSPPHLTPYTSIHEALQWLYLYKTTKCRKKSIFTKTTLSRNPNRILLPNLTQTLKSLGLKISRSISQKEKGDSFIRPMRHTLCQSMVPSNMCVTYRVYLFLSNLFDQRQNLMHRMHRRLLGAHHIGPVQEVLALNPDGRTRQVLDLGTGTGKW